MEHSWIREILERCKLQHNALQLHKTTIRRNDVRWFTIAAPEHRSACARRMCAAHPRQFAGDNEVGRCTSCYVRAGRRLCQPQ